MPEEIGADLPLFVVGKEDAVDAPRQQPRKVVLAEMQRKLSQILSLHHEDVEGIELHFVVVLAAVQAVEVRSAIDTEQHGFAIDDE